MAGDISQAYNAQPSVAPIADGGSIDSMLEGGGTPTQGATGVPAEQYYEGATPAAGSGEGKAVEPPGPVEDDTTSTGGPRKRSSVLNIELPSEAQVFINDKLTKTQGTLRSYRSRSLELGQEYKYQVKVVLVRNGKELVQTRLVTMRSGLDETVRFDFETVAESEELPAPLTTLALKVPADAKVTLCGNETNRLGTNRTFTTNSLKPGKVWNDYQVVVEFERDGSVVKEERTLDMVAGETYSLAIGVEKSNSDSIALK